MEKPEISENQKNQEINLISNVNNENVSNTLSKNIINNPQSASIFNNNMQSIKTITGTITAEYIDDYAFTQQFYNYNNNLNNKNDNNEPPKNEGTKKFRKNLKKTREISNDPKSSKFSGPWAKYKDEINFEEEKEQIKINNTNNNNQEKTELDDDILAIIEKGENTKEKNKKAKNVNIYEENPDFVDPDEESEKQEPKVLIEYDQGLDYLGRSFIYPPSELKNTEHNCFIPKKLKYTYNGHNKLVQRIQFFPKYGHLLLSCSQDRKIKIWDVFNHKKCIQTYLGHSMGVRDISFSFDGKQFLSTSFDKSIKLWDTETGKVIRSYELKKIPLCIKYNIDIGHTDEFIVGTNYKKIFGFDVRDNRINKPTEVYDEHFGSINSITFIENGEKFISTSDDKKIFVWDCGIPNAIKHISDPQMYSISASVLHPGNNHYLGQSLDNKIVTYEIRPHFKRNKKRTFEGHVNAGNTCGIDCSSDGRFVCSGDADGKIWFWDFITTRNYTTINAHKGVVSDIKWNPVHPSLVASCAWDGTIKLWDKK